MASEPALKDCSQEKLIAMMTMGSTGTKRRCGKLAAVRRPLIDGNCRTVASQPQDMCHSSWSESYRKGCGDDSVQYHRCHAKRKQRISIRRTKLN
jgi:hypothetical protein